ncbi:hypothetical protein LX15_001083 [Streptoalloteichus tenebrarius]|uniref:Uncharacterized protein n=1 Tax=Streptoalloteichus tenebrarius (strain ATCC 17920 / DSM 40477 / JCM 4838 / CBS 697.72 / NBRC 16177 / NCIMB 11028 / NRRL B-12390 / A12253. 1 / ISP 5477) TaxID=1933 RepID=A0ABT1HPI2_STRSD|nr:hypothetical protein [Streptoalloteichus tenebrarius]
MSTTTGGIPFTRNRGLSRPPPSAEPLSPVEARWSPGHVVTGRSGHGPELLTGNLPLLTPPFFPLLGSPTHPYARNHATE